MGVGQELGKLHHVLSPGSVKDIEKHVASRPYGDVGGKTHHSLLISAHKCHTTGVMGEEHLGDTAALEERWTIRLR